MVRVNWLGTDMASWTGGVRWRRKGYGSVDYLVPIISLLVPSLLSQRQYFFVCITEIGPIFAFVYRRLAGRENVIITMLQIL